MNINFSVVRKGYDRLEVDNVCEEYDRRIKDLQNQVEINTQNLSNYKSHIEQLNNQLEEKNEPSYTGLGKHVAKLLTLIDQESKEIRSQSENQAKELINNATTKSNKLLENAKIEKSQILQIAENDCKNIIIDGKKQASSIIEEANDYLTSRKEKGDYLYLQKSEEIKKYIQNCNNRINILKNEFINSIDDKMNKANEQINGMDNMLKEFHNETDQIKNKTEERAKQILEEVDKEFNNLLNSTKEKLSQIKEESLEDITVLKKKRETIHNQLISIKKMLSDIAMSNVNSKNDSIKSINNIDINSDKENKN